MKMMLEKGANNGMSDTDDDDKKDDDDNDDDDDEGDENVDDDEDDDDDDDDYDGKEWKQTMGGSDSCTQTTQPLVTTPTANKQK